MPPVRQRIEVYSDYKDIEEFLQCASSTWHQQEMGELGSYAGNMSDMYSTYPENCTGVTPGIADDPTCRITQEEDRNYTVLTPTQSYTQVTPSAQQEYISQTFVKQEFGTRPYSYNYQTSPISSSYSTNMESEEPSIQILEQPFPRHRFRYQSERGSHGGMNGIFSKDSKKTYPTVQLVKFRGDPSSVRIRGSLYTDTDTPELHVHRFHGKTVRQEEGDCELTLNRDMCCSLQGISIIFTAKKEVANILYQRKLVQFGEPQNEERKKQLKADADSEAKKLNMNSVRICFEAIVIQNGTEQLIAREFSSPIHNQRELKITRFSKYSGSCRGEDEVYLLCEKVNKKEIKIRFFECDLEGNRIWQAFASFSPESDVHHQVAIVFKTPRYHRDIQEPVKVHFELFREKDGEISDQKDFLYTPIKLDTEAISRKRARKDGYGGEDEFGRGPPNDFYGPGNFQDPSGNAQGHSYFQQPPSNDMNYGGGGYYANGSPGTSSTFSPGSSSSSALSPKVSNLPSQSPGIAYSPSASITQSPGIAYSPSASITQSPGIAYSPSASITQSPSSTITSGTSTLSPQSLPAPSPSNASVFSPISSSTILGDISNPNINPAEAIFAANTSPDEIIYPELSLFDDERIYDLMEFKCDGQMAEAEMYIPHRKNEPRDQFDITTALQRLTLDSEAEKQRLSNETTLTVPSVRQRSSSLVEDRDLRAINESNALRICLNQLSQSLRSYAITADPRALIMPLRNLMAKADRNGDNPLHLAIIHHASNKTLLQHFISVVAPEFLNQTNNLFQTPLHLAVLLKKPSIVQLLLMKGANPEIQDNEGNTAVHLAVKKKHLTCLAVLLNKQSYRERRISLDFANILNYEGLAAIHLAVKNEDEDAVCKLADAEANINIGDGTSGRTPLHFAVELYPTMITCLLQQIKIDVDCQDFAGDTPLHLASICGNEDIVYQLMHAEANPLIENYLEPEGATESEIPRGVTPFDIGKNEAIKSILSGIVPEEISRRINNSRKASLQDSFSEKTSSIIKDQSHDYDATLPKPYASSSRKLEEITQHDSGYTSGPQINEISEDCLQKLCALLDPPNKGWEKLVEIYIDRRSDDFWKLTKKSPTRAVIDLIKEEGNFNKEVLKNVLEVSGLLNSQITDLLK